MKRFIPAWYSTQKWWANEAIPFYLRWQIVNDFDDLISLMGMHIKNEALFEMVILNYMPDLRTFLHRHELFEAPYWSLFDCIQGFSHQTPQSIDYRQLNWPEETEFVHSPVMIRAITSQNAYSDIHFSQEGYLMWIESFRNDIPYEQYVFDDRGFLSSYMKANGEGQWSIKYYMTMDGDWIMKEDLLTHVVTIHPKYVHRFKRQSYEDMSKVIAEFLSTYVQQHITPEDVTIVASDVRHNALITEHLKSEKICFSVFQKRETWKSEEGLASMVNGSYWLVDTLENAQYLEKYRYQYQLTNSLMRITPFDVRMTPNISSQLYETFIGVWIDGLTQEALHQMNTQLITSLEREPNTRLTLLTRHESAHVPHWVHQEVYRVQEHFEKRLKQGQSERNIEGSDTKGKLKYISIKSVPFEHDVVEAISNLRLVIDWNEEPDLFLQICCMGAGLPQINRLQTDYVQHERNGYIISDIESLPSAVDFYLLHLKNWNRSYAYSMKLAKMYASEEILKQLDDWLEGEIREEEI
ncbi:TPA: accessory Sec system protein Asp1 [Staphylococcus delphini]|nr:accessory Sec system protein Asp1 [Staphylococcus delphini]